jgi:Vacuolar protein sorting-associated protein 62
VAPVSARKWLGALAAAFVFGVVCGGALIFVLKESHEANPLAPDEGRAFAPVEDREAGVIARRFRPRLMFDSGEQWRPQSIASLLAERGADGKPLHEFCIRSPGTADDCEAVGDIGQFEALVAENRALGSSTYLDIHGRGRSDFTAPERSEACRQSGLLDCDDQPGSAIYYHVTSSNQRFYVDYWWFLRFNHFGLTNCSSGGSGICDEHEGDWEGVTLVTAPEDEHSLDYVVYAAHRGTFRYPAQQLERQGQRPVVYVASGSHASYPRACTALIVCSQPIAIAGLLDLPETDIDGRRAWARNDEKCEPGGDGSCLLPLPGAEPGQTSWTTWAGLWGETCGTRCRVEHPQAPASPGLQTRFQTPWCSTQEGSLTCDSAAQGCSDWLGPLVAALACNPSAIARGLRTPEELPGGGLTLAVTAPDGARRRLSATTRGVVQALGPPLRPGSHVVVGDVGASTEILLRARQGIRLLEARFDPFEAGESGETFEITVVASQRGAPVLRAVRGDGTRISPIERRRVTLRRP